MSNSKSFFDAEFKFMESDDGTGIIRGYLNTWNVDLYGDTMKKGAFKNWIDRLKREGKSIPLLIEHDSGRIAGNWKTESFKEDEKGLYGEASFNLETTEGREAYSNAKMLGSSWGLSIGFFTLDSEMVGNKRSLLEVDLFETSLVVLPANQQSGVTEVKTVRDVEKGLRSLGYSIKTAKTIISQFGTNCEEEEVQPEEKQLSDDELNTIKQLKNISMAF